MPGEKVLTVPLSKMAAELAEKHELSKKAAGEFLADFVDLLVKHLKKGNKARVTGLGIFQVKKRPARLGRNPLTGEQIKIKASKKLAFRAAKEVKDAGLKKLLTRIRDHERYHVEVFNDLLKKA